MSKIHPTFQRIFDMDDWVTDEVCCEKCDKPFTEKDWKTAVKISPGEMICLDCYVGNI